MNTRKLSFTSFNYCLFLIFVIKICGSLAKDGTYKGPVQDGFYKITSAEDGSALTATWKGRPRQVITAPWEGKNVQEWKIKAKVVDGSPLQIIRNEIIRDNEVSKESNYNEEKGQSDFLMVDWNFIATNSPNTFVLNNGFGCLINTGSGSRIEIGDCDPSSLSQQWIFTLLFNIPKQQK